MDIEGLDLVESCQFNIGSSHYAAYPSVHVSIKFMNEERWSMGEDVS
jgi:hypothetical protein